MKHAKKRNQTPLIVALSAAAVLLVAAIIVLLFLSGRENQPDEPTNPAQTAETVQTQPADPEETSASSEATAPADETDPVSGGTDPTEAPEIPTSPTVPEDLAIDTPYATLRFPGEWRDTLSMKIAEEDLYRVTFVAKLASGKTQDLFCISFGGSADTAIGRVKTPDGSYVNVQLEVFDFTPDSSWSEDECTTVGSMHDAINFVLDHLAPEKIPAEQPTEPALKNEDEVVIETSYMTLRYPGNRKDTLKTVVEDNAVHFYCTLFEGEEIHLFSVYFGGNLGTAIAEIQAAEGNILEVRLAVSEIEPDAAWTKEQKNLVFGMQEDLNYLLEHING